MYSILQKIIEGLWAKPPWMLWPLLPISWVFMLGVSIRHQLYTLGVFKQKSFNVPVIIIGNLSLGGTGKTPLLMYSAKMLQDRGLKIGVISRGYKGSHQTPTFVNASSDPAIVGDEPCLIYQRLQCPVVVAKNRVAALEHLLANHSVDVVLSDDGLQHYALARAIEIVLMPMDAANANTYCLPVGPVREPLSRLKTVDLIIYNTSDSLEPNRDLRSYTMQYKPDGLYNHFGQKQSLEAFKGLKVHALAGIANPGRFFSMLQAEGLDIIAHPYPDHYAYKASDILFNDRLPVIMTEKDFVKCTSFVQDQHWVLPVHVILSEGFDKALWALIQTKLKQN